MKIGSVVLADEFHTPDSRRYRFAASYADRFERGAHPESFDRDFVRSWVAARYNPYKDEIPEIPEEIVLETAEV